MRFSQFKANRLAEMVNAQWGDLRVPDLLALIAYAKPRRVLEIGSYAGVSTEVFALHCEHVTTIDPSPTMTVRRQLHGSAGAYPHVRVIRGYSLPEMDRLLDAQEKYDFIYLDGDHSYEMVNAEIKSAKCLIPRLGGWIAGHDYCDLSGDCPGVPQAVNEAFGLPLQTFSDGSWIVKWRPPC